PRLEFAADSGARRHHPRRSILRPRARRRALQRHRCNWTSPRCPLAPRSRSVARPGRAPTAIARTRVRTPKTWWCPRLQHLQLGRRGERKCRRVIPSSDAYGPTATRRYPVSRPALGPRLYSNYSRAPPRRRQLRRTHPQDRTM
ncbi:uncharacterized protein METZ01_LOCUS232715, partial [marine metagenome]